MSMHKNLITLCCAAAFALGLAACSSSDDPPPPTPPGPVEPMPSAYEAGKAAIMAAMTEADAQAAYDAIDLSMVSGSEAASLMMALDDRVAALMAASAYARGKAAIMAAMTAAEADAAYAAVDKTAITGAEADSLMMALNTRKMEIATAGRIDMQKQALMTAAGMIDTSDLSTQDLVDAAKAGIVALRQALTDAADVSEADKTMYMSTLNDAVKAVDMAQGGIDTATRRMNQMDALSSASTMLQTALAALAGTTPTQAQLDAANSALTALNAAIMGGGDLTDTEKAPYQREASNAAAPIQSAQMAFDDAEDEADKTEAEMMAATAAKLYAGIAGDTLAVGDSIPTAGTGNKIAYYTSGGDIGVLHHDSGNTNTLREDKDAMVAAHHGWEGRIFTLESENANLGGTYEAVVYSNVQAPTMGKKFGSAAAVTPTGAYQYQLVDGALNNANGLTDANAARVALTDVTRTAGTETFKLPDPNPQGATMITVPGSFHGVLGTYSCTPSGGATTCTASVAATMGFTLGGGTWTFAPSDANARVSEAADEDYAAYGWWIYEPKDGAVYPFTVGALHSFRGTAGTVDIANLVAGTATYVGGAAGQYALTSSTGGTNDGGQFTATATLRAKFGDATAGNTITGTIDNFMGADEMSRDWSVELNETTVGNDGVIAALTTDATAWTIGDADAAASGQWSGRLREEGDDGVPQVATGVFYTEYGTAGKMIGGFGANKQ